jgi:hypothetical protein
VFHRFTRSGLFTRSTQRPVSSVPGTVSLVLLLALGLQIILHGYYDERDVTGKSLTPAPSELHASLLGLGDNIAIAKVLMLWLQAFDNQPGLSIPLARLDYEKVTEWLQLILELDPRGQYPLFAAARIYAGIQDENKQRRMLEFVYRNFFEDPNHRWPALAHAVYIAKHRLNDMPLALKYAEAMAENVTANDVPFWVKQMHIYVLEDMGELEAARILLGGLIESNAIRDPNELEFLRSRLRTLEEKTE